MPDAEAGHQEPGATTREVSIRWNRHPEMRGTFANHMVVQFDGNDFHLSFFELVLPIALAESPPGERVQQVDAQCVARIVINRNRMPAFLEALTNNVQRHLGLKSESE